MYVVLAPGNAIIPGLIETPMTKAVTENKMMTKLMVGRTPAGRVGYSEDCGPVAAFLASSAADFVTGTSIPIDGGYSIAMQPNARL
jgi:2-deoxy-D-gluconate 3-dehydrogenase